MNCPNCHQHVIDTAIFCNHCGTELKRDNEFTSSDTSNQTNSVNFSNVANKINSVAGIDTPVQIKFREVFSKVFAKHTEDEAEQLFNSGTSQTTPEIEQIVDTWPKPWLFARVFVLAALIYMGLYIGVEQFHNMNFLPGVITLGSFMVPITILIFFWEMNAPQNISIYQNSREYPILKEREGPKPSE